MPKVIKGVDVPVEKHKAGEIIFEEDTQGTCFYIVKQGQVEIFKNYGRPNQFHIALIGPGRVFGEISVINGQPRWATAVAKTSVEVSKVSASALQGQMAQCPTWFRAIIMDIVERFRTTDELLVAYGLEAKNAAHNISSGKETHSEA